MPSDERMRDGRRRRLHVGMWCALAVALLGYAASCTEAPDQTLPEATAGDTRQAGVTQRSEGAAGSAPGAATPADANAYRVVGQVVQFYTGNDVPLLMPTDVAVDRRGTVYVADGVNRRVLIFDPDRGLAALTRVGEFTLDNPLSLLADDTGALWIVDPGLRRVFVLNADRELQHVYGPDFGGSLPGLDLGGIALSRDRSVLWLSNNDYHQLLRVDLATGALRVVGQFGESLGEFHYPFGLATTPENELLVADVINGRVERLNQSGVPTGVISAYGVTLGQVFRPKDVATDAAGNIWISDGVLNCVQAFTPDGRLIDVLRNPDGSVLRLDAALGITFGPDGALYVAELGADRVVRIAVTLSPAAPAPQRTTVRGEATTGPQARGCTVCHMEWMRPLVNGRATTLADVPPNPADQPAVSRPMMCRSCHDGSVGDARRRVWVEHGHRIGVTPPATMTVPERLPLRDGQLACRTCHSAHTLPETRTTIEKIVFLRVEHSANELCMGCHSSYAGGQAAGMHPLAEMPVPLPPELTAHAVEDLGDKVTCLVCHSGHGAQHSDLLRLDPDRNQLCLSCHATLQPDLMGADVRTAHGQLPTLSTAQVAVAEQFAARIGDGNVLLCATCHKTHAAQTNEFLLAFDPAKHDTCADCHTDRQSVIGSSHDLRTNHPAVANIMGVTPEQGGACSGCHTAHRDARAPQPSALDPSGKCTMCHIAGGLAADATLGPVNHPVDQGCSDCHNVHDPCNGHYLAQPVAQLCSSCHENAAQVVAGPHNIKTDPEAWPAPARSAGDACLACHQPHGNEQNGLYRMGRVADYAGPGGACVACHPNTHPQQPVAEALVHPRRLDDWKGTTTLPLVQVDGVQEVDCESCHNPHAGGQPTHLLRVAADQDAQDLCIQCHAEQANIRFIGHADVPLQQDGFKTDACRPCHVTHAPPDSIETHFLWPRALTDFPGYSELPIPNRHCLACHREGGPVAPPAIATHPNEQMFNPFDPNEPGYLPLFNDQGAVDPAGHIACRTCHLTHGRSNPAAVPGNLGDVSSRELRARAWHVRSFGPANVCTTCHGLDALRRFMYFHDAARRGGPIDRSVIPG